jgi:hypothetical protein
MNANPWSCVRGAPDHHVVDWQKLRNGDPDEWDRVFAVCWPAAKSGARSACYGHISEDAELCLFFGESLIEFVEQSCDGFGVSWVSSAYSDSVLRMVFE